MSILTRKRAGTSSPDMPRGFDDPTSPLFVPEHLRPYWADAAEVLPRVNLHELVTQLTWSDAVAVVDARVGDSEETEGIRRRQGSLKGEAEEVQGELLKQNLTEYTERAKHAAIAPRAAELYADDQRRRENEEHLRQTHTCPVCGVYDLELGGAIEYRTLVPGYQDPYRTRPELSLRSCIVCHALAANLFLEQAAAEPSVWLGRSRGEAVRIALDNLKGLATLDGTVHRG